MPYLNVDLDYFTHPKVVRLIGLLGPQHVSVPIRLWCYVGKHHCDDGALKGYSTQEIESILGWKGQKGDLIAALVKVGFLDVLLNAETETYQVHDWLEHAGHLAAFKKRAKASAEKRWGKLASSNATSIQNDEITNAPNHLNHLILPNLPTKPILPGVASTPPNRKCAALEKDEPCQSYAEADSRYCSAHREFYRAVQERMKGKGVDRVL